MPRQNRVTPLGTIEAVTARGTLTGNRGILHDRDGRLGKARWRHPHWISCRLDWRGVRRPLMAPGTWTELFFLDEAVALAAGHRPCAYCRRPDYRRFVDAWRTAGLALPDGRAFAPSIDTCLHSARIDPGTGGIRLHEAEAPTLPDGTMVTDRRDAGSAWLVLGRQIRRWSHEGYDRCEARPVGLVRVLTPAPLVAVLRAGYRPALHASAVGYDTHHRS